MTILDVYKKIKEYQTKQNIESVAQTSVVSPLFPGQFNYCLDELHIYRKYGDFISVGEEHFQKIQPAIRLADFDYFFQKSNQDGYHLASFTIATINGGHIVDKDESLQYYRRSVEGILDFLVNFIGLDRKRIKFSYYSGGATGKEIEASRKKENQLLKVETDKIIPPDDFHKILFDIGLDKDQLIPDNKRDNFLTTNWDVTKAPWGYRNEIFYVLDNGYLLDIATIERMVFEPIIESRDGINYVVDIKSWDKNLIINACGIERLALASQSNLESIFDLNEFKFFNNSLLEVESARVLHRVFTDDKWDNIRSKQRREKLNKLTRILSDLDIDKIRKIMETNATIYSSIFPELANGIELAIGEISNYRSNRRDLSQILRQEKRNRIREKRKFNMGV